MPPKSATGRREAARTSRDRRPTLNLCWRARPATGAMTNRGSRRCHQRAAAASGRSKGTISAAASVASFRGDCDFVEWGEPTDASERVRSMRAGAAAMWQERALRIYHSVSPLRRPVEPSASRKSRHKARANSHCDPADADARRRSCHRHCSWLSWETRFDCGPRVIAPMGAMIYNKTLRH